MEATPEMRRVHFTLRDRITLVPVELVSVAKWPFLLAVLLLLLSGLSVEGYSASRLLEIGLPSAAMVLVTSFGSLVLGPALLPWLPGRPFSIKGLWVGGLLLAMFVFIGWIAPALHQNRFTTLAWCLLVPAIASLLVLAFTGASTYTSLSGVRRETRIALPLQLCAVAASLLLWLVGRFV